MENVPDFISPDDPFSEAQISKLRQLTEFDLPEDYVSFVRTHGGGLFPMDGMVVDVKWQRFDGTPVGEDEDDADELEDMHPFFTLWNPEQIIEEVDSVKRVLGTVGAVVPAHYFPIAHDTGGAGYWFDLSSEKPGSVWIRHANFNFAWGEGNNLYAGFVADSFTDLLTNRLKPAPEGW